MNSLANSIKIVITGSQGFLGFHIRSALFAKNCAANFNNQNLPYKIILAPRLTISNVDELASCLEGADCLVHLAGINRSSDSEVEYGNIELADILIKSLNRVSSPPQHLIYANTLHVDADTPYGRGKRAAGTKLENWVLKFSGQFTNLFIPHIFGEYSKPFYNSVTATLCHQVAKGIQPTISDGASVELLHAGEIAKTVESAILNKHAGKKRLCGTHMEVADLYKTLRNFKRLYENNRYPDLKDKLTTQLFNTYRSFEFPDFYPRSLELHNDDRGTLFEAVKGGGGGQSFLSWTNSGVERGNHFHLMKVERFLVVSGTAKIKVRKLFDKKISIFNVSGDKPQAVDMPTLCTHSIVNTGNTPLLTMFWAHEIFDPNNPDTFAHSVEA